MAERRTFVPVALSGVAAAALTAVAAGQTWGTATVAGTGREVAAKGTEVAPLAVALALVALAAWGAVLVLRSTSRRVFAGIGLVASLGSLVAVLVSYSDIAEVARSLAGDPDGADAAVGAWWFTTAVAAASTAVTLLIAVREAPRWPEMGAKYDAPGAREHELDQADLWKAIDEGHDPTV